MSVLMCASTKSDIVMTKELLRLGANVDQIDEVSLSTYTIFILIIMLYCLI